LYGATKDVIHTACHGSGNNDDKMFFSDYADSFAMFNFTSYSLRVIMTIVASIKVPNASIANVTKRATHVWAEF
jgi:hypothetical protein